MRNSRSICAAALILTVAAVTPLRAAQTAAGDELAVLDANTQFYAALNSLFQGEMAPMEAIWSHADDVTYMGPTGGMQFGWEQVRPIWQQQADKQLGGIVEPRNLHATVGEDLAIVVCFEVGDNLINQRADQVDIRATNVFRKENGQWKMIGHQTDLLPFLTTQ